MLWLLEKVGFKTDWASPQPWKKLNVLKQEHFGPYFTAIEEKIMPPLKLVLKVGKIMWILNYILSSQKNSMVTWRKK